MHGRLDTLLPQKTMAALARFLGVFGEVYEHSPWIPEAAWRELKEEKSPSFALLAQKMEQLVCAAPKDRQLALLRAHPELAGRAALEGDLTNSSQSEQASAGLDQCNPSELAEISRLNALYQKRFGFPFIIAVRGLSRADVLASMRKRSELGADEERVEALKQVNRIAKMRLEQIATCKGTF